MTRARSTYTVFLGFLVGPFFQVATIGTQLTEALAGLERTREILRERPEDEDPRRSVALPGVRGEVAFDDVGFAYREGETVLQDVSLRAAPGTVTALVGPSGAGKTTMIGLVCAFHAPTSGRVVVDGVDLATVRLDSYRRHLGVVLQETFLFDGTIRENVAFSRPAASEAQILEACRIAHVGEFAEGFADGYDTVVGERGVRLSGGQRQRVAIARAILADPRILILDEATSSLDLESEALIQEGLSWLMKGRTTFVIAHRLSTIRRADQILVIEKGASSSGAPTRSCTRRPGATARCTTGSTGWRRTSSSRPAKETRWRTSLRSRRARVGGGFGAPGSPRPVSAPSPFQDAVVLAPLTVGGNLPFRRLCTEMGADVTVGEMAVVKKLLGGSSSEFALLKSHPDERLFGVQLADKRAETLVEGARLAESRGRVSWTSTAAARSTRSRAGAWGRASCASPRKWAASWRP